jgi:hypothetical protein
LIFLQHEPGERGPVGDNAGEADLPPLIIQSKTDRIVDRTPATLGVVAISLPRFARDELEAAGQGYQGEFFFEVAVVIAVSSTKKRSIEGQGAPSRNNSGPAS